MTALRQLADQAARDGFTLAAADLTGALDEG